VLVRAAKRGMTISRSGVGLSRAIRRESPVLRLERSPSVVFRGGPISTEPRINDRIRVNEVRLVGPNGEQVGIVAIGDALRLAQEADLDLVEVAPMARPPVCKLMDYGKFKYETAMKAREARKNQAHTVIKEMKLRPKIDPHDYATKRGHVVRFLKQGDKVKITIMFRGREQSRPELGYRLLQRLAADVEELGFVESAPKQDGRNMIMVLGPHKKKAEARAEKAADKAERSERHDRNEAPEPTVEVAAEAPAAVAAAAVTDAESGVA
jgi:translation initiation factor IF-3